MTPHKIITTMINDVTSIYPPLLMDFRKEYLVITNKNWYDISVKYADTWILLKMAENSDDPVYSKCIWIAAESVPLMPMEDVAMVYLEELRKNRGIAGEISTTITSTIIL